MQVGATHGLGPMPQWGVDLGEPSFDMHQLAPEVPMARS